MPLMETILRRRSVRKYSSRPVPEESLKKILEAGLLAPTSMNRKPCEFYVVKDRGILEELASSKSSGAGMLPGCGAAIAVFADSQKADTWTEDCSIALSYMNLMAAQENIGSCWVQIHLRSKEDGTDAEDAVRKIFALPERFRIVGLLALGVPDSLPAPHTMDDIDWNRVHIIE